MSHSRAGLLRAIEALGLPSGGWFVHGSGVLVLHGLIEAAGDVDIVATDAAWDHATGLGSVSAANTDRVVRLAGDVEIFDGWMGESLEGLLARITMVAGVPCAALSDVLAFKERLG